jgi:DNA mismatch endonuclease (patch repair protein)
MSRPPASSAGVSRRMSRLARRDTRPELQIRSALHRRGLRFRLQEPIGFDRRRRIDIVFPREKVAIFVDGCFWHSCPEHATYPVANAEFWTEKLARNVARDEDTNVRLSEEGWEVIRVWEHEDPDTAAERIEQAVRGRRSGR